MGSNVFIVQVHNDAIQQMMARTLEKLGLRPSLLGYHNLLAISKVSPSY